MGKKFKMGNKFIIVVCHIISYNKMSPAGNFVLRANRENCYPHVILRTNRENFYPYVILRANRDFLLEKTHHLKDKF